MYNTIWYDFQECGDFTWRVSDCEELVGLLTGDDGDVRPDQDAGAGCSGIFPRPGMTNETRPPGHRKIQKFSNPCVPKPTTIPFSITTIQTSGNPYSRFEIPAGKTPAELV